ncbi:DUF3035 domain-containing protein [Candidatus Pelagibacter sp. Uisw_090]|uniref:DUF3035 domain-containing protein n=1 Tax=Candidatus Pelagibacter sp. Uisw_090 TaxID=3230993 RepID=UPI0039E9E908
MNKIKPVIVIFLTLLFLNACSAISGGIGASKKKGSDEFLVEKKAPLVLPPSFGELPEPRKKIDENIASTKENTLSIKDIIDQSSSIDSDIDKNKSNNSKEKLIIKKIIEQ